MENEKQEETQIVASYRDKKGLTNSMPLSTFIKELDGLLPVDKIFAYVENSEVGALLAPIGRLKVVFEPEAGANQKVGEILNKAIGMMNNGTSPTIPKVSSPVLENSISEPKKKRGRPKGKKKKIEAPASM